MTNPKLLDWIKLQKKLNKTEHEIKHVLMHHGHKEDNIIKAFADLEILAKDAKAVIKEESREEKAEVRKIIAEENLQKKEAKIETHLSFHELLLTKGRLFAFWFYFFMGSFLIPMLIVFVLSLSSLIKSLSLGDYFAVLNFILAGIILPFMLLFFLLHEIKRKDLNKSIMIIFFQYFIVLLIFPLMDAFYLGKSVSYLLIIVISIVYGNAIAYLFSHANKKFTDFFKMGFGYSIAQSIIIGINGLTYFSINLISKYGDQLNSSLNTNGSIPLNTVKDFGNLGIMFMISFTLFNLPFIIYYLKKNDKNNKLLISYIIPTIIFLVVSITFELLGDYLIIFLTAL